MRDRKRNIAFAILGIVIIWAMVVAATQSSQGGNSSPLYSIYRYDSSGTAALRELFEARNIKVSLLERQRMRASDRGVLFQVMPLNWSINQLTHAAEQGEHFEVDTASLIDWVAQGNTVVQLTRSNTGLVQALDSGRAAQLAVVATQPAPATQPGINPNIAAALQHFTPNIMMPDESLIDLEQKENRSQFSDQVHQRGTWIEPSAEPGKPGITLGTLELVGPGADAVVRDKRWRPLCVTDRGVPLAVEQRIGRGRIVVIRAPSPALNRALVWSDNAAILLALAGNGPVLLDEWSHGQARDDSVMGMIYQVGLWPVLAQAIAALLLYVWSTLGYRRIDPAQTARRPSSRDQIRTLGFLYSRSLRPGNAATRVHTEVLSRVAGAARCSPSQVQARLASSNPEAAQKLARILADVAFAAQTEGPTCLRCGYSLAGSTSAQCPDCGAMIPDKTRKLIAETPVDVLTRAPAEDAPKPRGVFGVFHKVTGAAPRPSQLIDDILIRALTASHQLALEITRDRRNS